MKKVILNIEGMTCSACSNGLEKYLKKQKGIIDVNVNLVMATVMIEYEDSISINQLEEYIKEAGFKSLGEKQEKKENKSILIKLIIFAILSLSLMYISMGHMINLPIPKILDMEENPKLYTSFLLIISSTFLIWGYDIIKNGIKNIFYKMPNMDSLVGIGVLVNYLYSIYNAIFVYMGDSSCTMKLYFEASSMIILFVKLGRYIDKKNKERAVDSIKNLVMITPKNGTILKNGKEVVVTINEINKGDTVITKPGEKISVDGTIIKGTTHTDESFITGESKPITKKIGDKVIAGSINYDGYIEYTAERIGKDSSISNIVNMVMEATSTKTKIQRLADKISGYFVPTIFVIAILSLILNLVVTKETANAFVAFVSVLVVACPCALGLATPLAMVVSIGTCSKKGILIKSSETLESLHKVDTIVLDKTGTITQGKLTVVDGKFSKENFEILQSLESKSNHPIAKSICSNIKNSYEVKEFEEVPGMGIKGIINNTLYFAGNSKFVNSQKLDNQFKKQEEEYSKKGYSIVYLFTKENVIAIVGLSDNIKPNMKKIISELYDMKMKVVMLTGDNNETAKMIADELNIKEVISNVSPKEKLEKVKELNKNNTCLMIGDGINDSPALKAALVGVSVANGTDISADSANIVLLNENMGTLCNLIKIGNKTVKIIKQNLFWALFYNICMIPLATGLLPIHLNPMIASLAMTLSSLTVVLNSLRLKK